MVNAAPIQRLSITKFLRLPGNRSMELINGHAIERNGCLQSAETIVKVISALEQYAQNSRDSIVLAASMGYRWRNLDSDQSDSLLKPDVTVIRRDRLETLDDPNPEYFSFVPDLAIKVIAKVDTVFGIYTKVRQYLAAGFPMIWIVDPIIRTVTVYPAASKPFMLSEDDEIRAGDALPGFVHKTNVLFPAS